MSEDRSSATPNDLFEAALQVHSVKQCLEELDKQLDWVETMVSFLSKEELGWEPVHNALKRTHEFRKGEELLSQGRDLPDPRALTELLGRTARTIEELAIDLERGIVRRNES